MTQQKVHPLVTSIAKGFASLVEQNRNRFPFGMTLDYAQQVERDMQEELRDMDESYELIWGHPRPTGR